MFYLHVEILRRGYYRLTAGVCKRLHLDSSNYLRAIVAWRSRYHRNISDYHRESHSDGSTDHLKRKLCRWIKKICCWMNYVWSWLVMVIADSSMIMRMSRDGRRRYDDESRCKRLKNQRWTPWYPWWRISTCW